MEWDIISNTRHTTKAILLTPAFYMWPLFSCTAHSFTKRYIFQVRTVHLSFLKFYHILTQRASCIKEKVFFPGFTKFRCDLLPLILQYTEKNDISTPVSIVSLTQVVLTEKFGKNNWISAVWILFCLRTWAKPTVCRILSQITWSPCFTFHKFNITAQHSVCPREN